MPLSGLWLQGRSRISRQHGTVRVAQEVVPNLRNCARAASGSATARTAKREYELSPFDVDCHVTLPWGSCPCNGGTADLNPKAHSFRRAEYQPFGADVDYAQLVKLFGAAPESM